MPNFREDVTHKPGTTENSAFTQFSLATAPKDVVLHIFSFFAENIKDYKSLPQVCKKLNTYSPTKPFQFLINAIRTTDNAKASTHLSAALAYMQNNRTNTRLLADVSLQNGYFSNLSLLQLLSFCFAKNIEIATQIFYLILQGGCNINYDGDHYPALIMAINHKNQAYFDLLIKHGADLKHTYPQNSTEMLPTYYAAQCYSTHPYYLETLIQHNAKISYPVLQILQENCSLEKKSLCIDALRLFTNQLLLDKKINSHKSVLFEMTINQIDTEWKRLLQNHNSSQVFNFDQQMGHFISQLMQYAPTDISPSVTTFMAHL
jgi:hypothetical protein